MSKSVEQNFVLYVKCDECHRAGMSNKKHDLSDCYNDLCDLGWVFATGLEYCPNCARDLLPAGDDPMMGG